MAELKDFLDHDDPIISGVAQDITILEKGINDGNLSREQFDELVQDLMEVDEVRRMADKLERKIMILQAFTVIKNIVGISLK